MTVFEGYARYYDLLYGDKDYRAEVTYLEGLIERFGVSEPREGGADKRLLELGCGTGNHGTIFVEDGFSVCGVDFSEEMLSGARKRIEGLPEGVARKIKVSHGDVRTVRLDERFDYITCPFHVINYQTTDSDLKELLETAAFHLEEGGLFIFDCWYGPAVESDRPELRVKRVEDKEYRITRIAEPEMDAAARRVDVRYELFITEKESGEIESLKEIHPMRYLFPDEVEEFLKGGGFELLHSEEWLTGKVPGIDTWSVTFVARKGGGGF